MLRLVFFFFVTHYSFIQTLPAAALLFAWFSIDGRFIFRLTARFYLNTPSRHPNVQNVYIRVRFQQTE